MDPLETTAGQDNTETTGNADATIANAPERAEPVTATEVTQALRHYLDPSAPKPVPGAKPDAASTEPAKTEPAKQPQKFTSMFDDKPEAEGDGGSGVDKADEAEGDDAKANEDDFGIVFPDGAVPDTEAIDILKGIAKESGMSKEQAQKLADAHMDAMRRYDEYRIASGLETIQKWEAEIKAHPEFGGANLEKNTEAAKLMIQKYGSARLKRDFNEMGVLSHPEFAFMLMRMSRDLSEGESIGGESQAMHERRTADILFGD